jgi:hypothetical protein
MAEIRISVNFEGLDSVQSDLDRIVRAIEPPSLTESLGVGADVFVTSAFDAAPKETGRLAASMHKEPDGEGWAISPGDVPYANIQNVGGDNYGNPLMTFMGRDGWISTTHVHLVGSHYMDDAFALGHDMAAEAVAQEINKNIEG